VVGFVPKKSSEELDGFLKENLDENTYQILSIEEAKRVIDPSGHNHGLLFGLKRLVQKNIGGVVEEFLNKLESMNNNSEFSAVIAEVNKENEKDIEKGLFDHGCTEIKFFGRFYSEDISKEMEDQPNSPQGTT